MTSLLKVGSVSHRRCGLVTVEMVSEESEIGRAGSLVFTAADCLTDLILVWYSSILVVIASDSDRYLHFNFPPLTTFQLIP